MKAVRIHSYGGSDVLDIEDIPIPEYSDDEVLIQIHATSVNPIDWKVREGLLQSRNLHTLPLTLGWDVSGVVARTGSKVTKFKPGDEVYTRPDVHRDGSYAEYIVVKDNIVDFKPRSITHLEAASLPLVGLTAWTALIKLAEIKRGQKVLIHAAAGGVGSLAVQIAKEKGCYIIGTSSSRNTGFVLNLGANEAIDYNNQDFSLLLKDIDVVFDTIGGKTLDDSWKVLKSGGILVSIAGHPDPETAKEYKVRAASFFVEPDVAILEQIRHFIDTGIIRPVIGSVFTLDEIKKAHDLSQSGRARGKIVIKII